MNRAAAPRLSVNLNKVALLRNARRTGIPDIVAFVTLARDAGADGITLHPRPDERHVRRDDVARIADAMAPWRPGFELNIEGYPDERLLAIADEVRPEQCTLVPDAPDAFTSEEGWRLDDRDARRLELPIRRLAGLGTRIVLFVGPDPAVAARAGDFGAAAIEIYTGGYAEAARQGRPAALLAAASATAEAARRIGLAVNVGHDLDLVNIPALVAAVPGIAEASIGHALTADALVRGFVPTVAAYKAALASPSPGPASSGPG